MRLREHPGKATLLAIGLSAAVVALIAAIAGFHAFVNAWSHLHPWWLVLTAGAEALAIVVYVLPYRAIARIDDGPKLPLPLAVRAVVAGFGPFALGGGFAIDKRTLHAIEDDEHSATVRVLGLGALEWALLAPIAWIVAVILLLEADSRVLDSLLWPWALAVPLGFTVGLWLSAPSRHERITRVLPSWCGPLTTGLQGVSALHTLGRSPRRWWSAWVGAGLYWVLDICAFYAAVRFVGMRPTLAEGILAYATGYALTRRSTPLAGAGSTEALMTLALHWVGQPLSPALAAVVAYRFFNFVLPCLPALLVHPRIKPLLDAADEGHTPAAGARRKAAMPLRSSLR
jgi:uncharacterized membrane protein YbhN (UPF0104 family)